MPWATLCGLVISPAAPASHGQAWRSSHRGGCLGHSMLSLQLTADARTAAAAAAAPPASAAQPHTPTAAPPGTVSTAAGTQASAHDRSALRRTAALPGINRAMNTASRHVASPAASVLLISMSYSVAHHGSYSWLPTALVHVCPYQEQIRCKYPVSLARTVCLAVCASEAPSQASSYAGPLTSAMTSSKVMRAVRDQATRSDSAPPPGGHGAGSNRLGPRDSLDSTGSSMASETGVVNSPMVEKQQQQPGAMLWCWVKSVPVRMVFETSKSVEAFA